MSDWRRELLGMIGAKPTRQNLKFLNTWQRWEGGHTNNSARFNWLNTTIDAPGVVNSINSVGVKAFDSRKNGINALAQTLLNGRYNDIVKGLKAGNPYTHDVSAGLQTWVSGSPTGNPGYAQKVLGGSVSKVKMPKQAPVQVGPPAFDIEPLKIAFEDDPEFLATLSQISDRQAQRSKLVSPRGSVRPVPVSGPRPGVIQAVQSQLGKPYVFGSGPDTSSFDCSDLIQWAYKQIGVDIPRDTYGQIKALPEKSWKNLQPGDLIYKNNGGHVVMYVGHGKVIAAPQTGQVVQYQPVSRFRSGGYHVRYVP